MQRPVHALIESHRVLHPPPPPAGAEKQSAGISRQGDQSLSGASLAGIKSDHWLSEWSRDTKPTLGLVRGRTMDGDTCWFYSFYGCRAPSLPAGLPLTDPGVLFLEVRGAARRDDSGAETPLMEPLCVPRPVM
ncbi:hypothetical protein ANANG_G00302470 [Anguilla anguilla]|uniref:Uncharacterized protein n=1 Tax=Anguilla anguilla TaxID=7936 RepID=A0A9D3RIB2_ANGAN|nr:hypothetical protein ANANG_G00302470 [Anguilla anguilla]